MSKYIVVTGAAGFIGSNLVKALNLRGETAILAVDDLTQGDKFANLVDCEIADYLHRDELLEAIDAGRLDQSVRAVMHQGACSDTTERDGRFMMDVNYRFSMRLHAFCQRQPAQFIYASSAAVYGPHTICRELPECEAPLNVYGYSKLLFDRVLRRGWDERRTQVVGLRYFNVYGPREQHKGRMASVAFHVFNQLRAEGHMRLFEGSHGYADGEQRRDFVSVEDCVAVNLHFLDHPERSGIFNVGTGRAQPFNDVATAVANAVRASRGEDAASTAELASAGTLRYVPFPEDLKGRYQAFTQADLTALRAAGYDRPFLTVEEGVSRYAAALLKAAG